MTLWRMLPEKPLLLIKSKLISMIWYASWPTAWASSSNELTDMKWLINKGSKNCGKTTTYNYRTCKRSSPRQLASFQNQHLLGQVMRGFLVPLTLRVVTTILLMSRWSRYTTLCTILIQLSQFDSSRSYMKTFRGATRDQNNQIYLPRLNKW